MYWSRESSENVLWKKWSLFLLADLILPFLSNSLAALDTSCSHWVLCLLRLQHNGVLRQKSVNFKKKNKSQWNWNRKRKNKKSVICQYWIRKGQWSYFRSVFQLADFPSWKQHCSYLSAENGSQVCVPSEIILWTIVLENGPEYTC